jgi:hypothetical protein
LNYVLDGIQPKRANLEWYVRLLLNGMKNGLFSMRYRWAEARGRHSAAQFISANSLRAGKALTEGAQGTFFPTGLQHSSVISLAHATLDHRHWTEREESLEATHLG